MNWETCTTVGEVGGRCKSYYFVLLWSGKSQGILDLICVNHGRELSPLLQCHSYNYVPCSFTITPHTGQVGLGGRIMA